MTTPELLAPAGDWESLRAAAANGADAVYFGLSAFNARARAANFTLEELPEVMAFLRARNVRGFVTMNTLIFSDELDEAQTYLAAIAAAGVDAVIVQDFGVVRLLKHLAPTLAVHGSTQMTLTEPRGIDAAKALGVERVVLARELSVAEIRKVTAGTDVPVEVFVHGALCVAYSGQCLTSEALGGRSANRGQCAQACRLPYDLIADGTKIDLGDRNYLLSPQDLAGFDYVGPLVDAGVISFKIEGRLKGGPYVAATCQTYRKAIDAAAAARPFALPRADQLDLAQTFSRGLTPGFLAGNDHQKLVRGRVPKSRGIRIGTVVSAGPRGVRVHLAEAMPGRLRPGDGVMFDLGRPESKEPGGRVITVDPVPGQIGRFDVALHSDSFDPKAIPAGTDVWKTDDPALTKRLQATYARDLPAKRAAVTAALRGSLGGDMTLSLSDGTRAATATWPGPLEVAAKAATTPDDIRAQLARLGDTPFELGDAVLDLPPGVLVPKSVLNDLRRRAVADLVAARAAAHPVADAAALATLRRDSLREPAPAGPPKLTVLVRNREQLDAVLAWTPPDGAAALAAVYCDFEDLRNYAPAVAAAKAAGVRVGLAPVRVWKPGEDGFQTMVVRANPDAVLVRNLGGLSFFQEHLPAAELIGDFSLNCANDLTADHFFRAGLSRVVPSFDLNWGQFEALVSHSLPHRLEPVIHQHMPMFHTEHCVFAAFLSTGKDHTDCGRPCDRHRIELKDRVGSAFPVHPDTGCRNTVFNSVPQSAAEYVGRMRSLGIKHFRIDLLRETSAETAALLARYARVVAGADDGRDAWKQLRALNQLGVTRGTLNLA